MAKAEPITDTDLKAKALPEASYLRALFVYDPVSGDLIWRIRRGNMGAGSLVSHLTNDGYLAVRIDGIRYQAHRVIWKMVTGHDPRVEIDHANCVRTDNGWGNLRASTPHQNRCNRIVPSGRLRGVQCINGVKAQRWTASIQVHRCQIHLGTFGSEGEAAAAYVAAARRFHGEFARVA